MSDRDRRWKGEGRVAFLAHREEIRAALRDGWPRAAVHGRLRGVLGISYQQFVRYVERYLADAAHGTTLRGSASPRSATVVARPTEPARAPITASDPRRTEPPPNASSPVPPSAGALPRFTYTPGQSSRDKLV